MIIFITDNKGYNFCLALQLLTFKKVQVFKWLSYFSSHLSFYFNEEEILFVNEEIFARIPPGRI
jgi:hypothetical protein